MFSVPIIHYKIENWKYFKNKILDVLPPESPENLDPKAKLYTDFFTSSTNLPNYFDVVFDIIKPYLIDFSKSDENFNINLIKDNSIDFVNMWYQKYYKGATHTYHNHGHSGWSSIIYVEFDPNIHEATKFISPFNDIWTGELEYFQPPVEEGDIVIFPSTIAHEAPANISDVRRTIISYNLRGFVDEVKATL
jgi:hypothetical protein